MEGHAPESPPNPRPAGLSRLSRDIEAFDRERLREAIEGFKVDERARQPSAQEPWVVAADSHADRARQLLEKGQIDTAWTAIKAASRELIEAYDEAELRLEADRVGREAKDKLHGWRASAVEDALSTTWRRLGDASRLRKGIARALEESEGKEDQATALRRGVLAALGGVDERDKDREVADLRKRVKAARAVLDEHTDNVYRRLQLLSQHLLRAGLLMLGCLVLASVALIVVLNLGMGSSEEQDLFVDAKSVVVVLTLGAVGGATSGLLTLLRPDAQSRIPDVRAKRYLVWLRPLMGAAAALGVVVILRSGLGGLRIDSSAVFAAAFAAGFSERLVGRAVESASAAITS